MLPVSDESAPILALLFLWGSGKQTDSVVVFLSLLLLFSHLVAFVPPVVVGWHLEYEWQLGALAVGLVALVPSFKLAPILGLGVFASTCAVVSSQPELVVPFALLGSLYAESARWYSLAALGLWSRLWWLEMLEEEGAAAAVCAQAFAFLVFHDVVVARLGLVRALYACTLAVLLSLASLVFVESVLSPDSVLMRRFALVVLGFQLNLFRRPQERPTWVQLQQIVGVSVGSFVAQSLVRGSEPVEQRLVVSAICTLMSLMFISKQVPGANDFASQRVWHLVYLNGAAEQQQAAATASPAPTPTPPTTAVTVKSGLELSLATKTLPEVMELFAQYGALQTSLARSEAQSTTSTSPSPKQLVSESNTLAKMTVVCEDILQAMQQRIAQLEQEHKVFAKTGHAPLANQAKTSLVQLQADFDSLSDLVQSKLKPKFAMKNEECMAALNRAPPATTLQEQEEVDVMLEVMRKRLKPLKSKRFSEDVPRAASPKVNRPQTPVASPVTLASPVTPTNFALPPPSSTSSVSGSGKSFLSRLPFVGKSRTTPTTNNESSMRTESSAGLSTASSSTQRRRRLRLPVLFGKRQGNNNTSLATVPSTEHQQ